MKRIARMGMVGLVVLLATGCDDGDDDALSEEAIVPDPDTCNPQANTFVATIDHPYFPLPVGRRLVYRGAETSIDDHGDTETVELVVVTEVTDQVKVVDGVETRVVTSQEFEDGELIETVNDFYAQAPDGTVCYFGEDVTNFEDDGSTNTEGSWRAGGGNTPGIIMPGNVTPGTTFAQENAPGAAEDHSVIVARNVPVRLDIATYTDTLYLIDWNPLDGQHVNDGEDKLFARDVGLVVDDVVDLTEID